MFQSRTPRSLGPPLQYSGTVLLLLVNLCIPYQNNGTAHSTYVFIVWKEGVSLPAMFNPLYSLKLFKRNSYNQSSHYENYGRFSLWMEAITCLPQNQYFSMVSKDKWDTKEDTGKSMKNALYVQWHGKRHLRAEAMSNSKKIKPVALVIIELRESEGIRQAVSQSVENCVK